MGQMLELPEDHVDVWAVDLARVGEEVSASAGLLSADELRRAANMRVESHRRHFILTRGALRSLLAGYLDADAAEIELPAGPHGKLALDPPALRFNLAHSGELALIAASAHSELGVDLELMRPRADPLRVARGYFTPAESDVIEAAPAEERNALLYRLWVAKEAFVKATGRGLSASLKSFSVQLEPGPPRLAEVAGDEAEARRWSLEELSVPPRYAAALVAEGRPGPVRLRRFERLTPRPARR